MNENRFNGGNPYNDFDGGRQDWVLVYPGPEGQLIFTPAWEVWCERIDDRRYLELYEKLATEGRVDGRLMYVVRTSGTVGVVN